MIGRARLLGLAVLAIPMAGFSPFEADEEHVAEGNARLEAGDPAAALRSYEAAERAVGSRPEIDHDRGHAELAAGRAEEAKASWRRAATRAPPALASRALQNLGTTLAAEGDREGALRAFSDALAKDPTNEDARFDLEVLLREGSRPEPPPSGAAGPSAGAPPPQGDGVSPEPRGDEAGAGQRKEKDERPADGAREAAAPKGASERRQPDARAGAGEDRRAGGPSGADLPEGSEPGRDPLSRQAAEALLDALRAREKHMPFFGRERRRETRRDDAAKDW